MNVFTTTTTPPRFAISDHSIDPSTTHDVVIHIKQKNIDEMKRIVLDISNPKSPNYGKHMSKEAVEELTRNDEGMEIVTEYLQTIGATITKKTTSTIQATSSIANWEHALNTHFQKFYEIKSPSNEIIRTMEYSIPSSLSHHIDMISNTVQFPPELSHGPVRSHVPIG